MPENQILRLGLIKPNATKKSSERIYQY